MQMWLDCLLTRACLAVLDTNAIFLKSQERESDVEQIDVPDRERTLLHCTFVFKLRLYVVRTGKIIFARPAFLTWMDFISKPPS